MIVVNARFLTQQITGVQRFAIELSIRLKKELGNEIVFVSPKNIIQDEIASLLDVKIIGSFTSHLWEQIDLPLFLYKNGKPILVNFCNTAPLFYKNKIITIHDIAYKIYPETYSKPFLLYYNFLIPNIIKNSKKIITVSNFSKNEIIKYYKTAEEKIEVVYNSVGESFRYIENKQLKNENYFLAVASLNKRKNLPLVIDAFELYKNKDPEAKLFIVGGVDDKAFSNLNFDKYKFNKNIFFKGRVSDSELIEYYSNCIAFVYPSTYEGFGIPPLEAQKCQVPAIISDESCFPEIFSTSVLYCKSNDPKSVFNQMELVSNENKRNEFITKGNINIERYSWDISALKVINLIKEQF